MRRTLLIPGLVAIAFLVLLSVVLLLTAPAISGITLRPIKCFQSAGVAVLSFELSNHTDSAFIFYPFKVETRNGTGWITCFKFRNDFGHRMPGLGPLAVTNCTFLATNLPSGAPLRLEIHLQETLTGVRGFLRRAELRLRHRAALSPFNTSGSVFGRPWEITSDMSVEPEPAGSGPRYLNR